MSLLRVCMLKHQTCNKCLGYNNQDEWCPPIALGPEVPLYSPNLVLMNRFTSNIPMPTLYSGDNFRKPKISVIEILLYNMAALLAGVAAGYDVRMSNVSPVHPMLQPPSIINDLVGMKEPAESEFADSSDRTLGRNTYHGPTRHLRPMLTAMSLVPDDTPLRHVDSPQHFLPSTISTTSGLGSNFTTNTSSGLSSSLGGVSTLPPTPSPRRKTSVSSFVDNNSSDYAERDHLIRLDSRAPIYVPGDYLVRKHAINNDRDFSQYGSGYFGSNYFPYRPEETATYERDYKSYPDYSSEYSRYQQDYSYEAARPSRVPQMGIKAGHRRTLSNISSQSNLNSSFRPEPDELSSLYDFAHLNLNDSSSSRPDRPVAGPVNSLQYPSVNRMRDYENLPFHQQNHHNYPTLSTIQPNTPLHTYDHLVLNSPSSSSHYEHSGGLEMTHSNKLRSSLKKYSSSNQKINTSNTDAGTPTNPTPPDSLTSDDSSYLSAKESISSQQSRVRFSPDQQQPHYAYYHQLPQQQQQQQQQQPLQQTSIVADFTTNPLMQNHYTSNSATNTPNRRMSRRHTGGDMTS